MSYGYSKQQQIDTVKDGFRHLVILGAGASKAVTLHRPERGNNKLPVMVDLVQTVGLGEDLAFLTSKDRERNFEEIYSRLHRDPSNNSLLDAMNTKIYNYFDGLYLPDEPTIYDYLVLSLRGKDRIATFNWDPLLTQAFLRNRRFTEDLPTIYYLHGNVAVGYNMEVSRFGPKGGIAGPGGIRFQPTPLLFPITEKDYTENLFINDQWEGLKDYLSNHPAIITIFGYSAPTSDSAALTLMKEAWKGRGNAFTRFEMIDIIGIEKLYKNWKEFIYRDHGEVIENFFESRIGMSPRRSGEMFNATLNEGKWPEFMQIPFADLNTLDEVWEWYAPLIEAEERYESSRK